MRNEKIHSILLTLVGGYLLYLAYQLFEKYRSGTQEMPDAVFIAAIIVFAAGGIGAVGFAWTIYRKQKREDNGHPEEEKTPGNHDPDPQ